MPIPDFDPISNLIPPYTGHSKKQWNQCPYKSTPLELCAKLGSTPKRVKILRGFLLFREKLLSLDFSGFHWIDGSFVENIESQEGRDPDDVDVVSFLSHPDGAAFFSGARQNYPDLFVRAETKARYHVDHFVISLNGNPARMIDLSAFWLGLFSHRKSDDAWKGILRLELCAGADDAAARNHLGLNP